MATINYNGMELEEVTEPQIFDPPIEMVVCDESTTPKKAKVIAILAPSCELRYRVVTNDNSFYERCALLPDHPKPRRGTGSASVRKTMPTIPGQDPEIMTSGEIAIAKRREKLNELLQHGDPFTGRFICSFGNIACITKEIIETERIPRYALGPGIGGSKILKYGPYEFGKDFSCIKPVRDKLNERMEKFRIGYGMWEHTYSFEDYDQMIKEILSVLIDKPKQVTECNNERT